MNRVDAQKALATAGRPLAEPQQGTITDAILDRYQNDPVFNRLVDILRSGMDKEYHDEETLLSATALAINLHRENPRDPRTGASFLGSRLMGVKG